MTVLDAFPALAIDLPNG